MLNAIPHVIRRRHVARSMQFKGKYEAASSSEEQQLKDQILKSQIGFVHFHQFITTQRKARKDFFLRSEINKYTTV